MNERNLTLSSGTPTSPRSNVGVGMRSPSVPLVIQKNLSASAHTTWDSASVRIEKKIRVYRTQTAPKPAASTRLLTHPANKNPSIEDTCRYFTSNPVAYAALPKNTA